MRVLREREWEREGGKVGGRRKKKKKEKETKEEGKGGGKRERKMNEKEKYKNSPFSQASKSLSIYSKGVKFFLEIKRRSITPFQSI